MSVSLELSSSAPTDREKIWSAIRELREFTQFDLAIKSHVDRQSGKIKDYLGCLIRAGIVEVVSRQSGSRPATYRLAQDKGVQAPRVRKNGVLLPPSGRTRMWKSMRILGTFTTRELAATSSLAQAPVAVNEADCYCKWLCRGGFLRNNGKSWTFIKARDTGPKAPQILRIRQLYDPNTDKIVYAVNTGRDDE